MEQIMDAGISAQLEVVQERYRFLAKLGSGGMADVFLGIQHGAEDFKRLVVIKRVHSAWLKKENALKMFINEARTVASLNHPHIVKIYDLSRMGNDICISMEYVDGENLEYIRKTALMRNQPVPLPIICKLMIEACEALHYAHSVKTPDGKKLNLVHRDIGPHNLMIDGNGYLKVIDFGIAKTTAQTELTSPGIIKGKFSYLAPDLFKHVNIDGRVDLYALGLVLHELVTLKRPFPFKKDVAVAEVLRRITTEDLPPVSSLMPDLPKELDAIVSKATNKDRDHRYQSGATFGTDLREFAESLGGAASTQQVENWFHEHYRERIARRREFERRAMLKASAPPALKIEEERDEEPPIVTNQTINISDISQFKARVGTGGEIKVDESTTSRRWLVPALVVSILLVVVVGGASLLYKAYRTEPLPESPETVSIKTEEENVVSDNLFIRTTPPGADIFVNGEKIGNTGSVGLNLRVEPGREHQVVLELDGYKNYSVKVPGESYGQRRIDVQLDNLIELAEAEDEKPEPEETAPQEEPEKIEVADNTPNLAPRTKKRKPSRSRQRTKRKTEYRSPASVEAAARPSHGAMIGNLDGKPSPTGKDSSSKVSENSQSIADFLGLTSGGQSQKSSMPGNKNQGATTATKTSNKSGATVSKDTTPAQMKPNIKLARLEPKPPAIEEPYRQSHSDLAKRRISGHDPKYPKQLLRRRKEAEVVVKITVAKTGQVRNYSFIKDDSYFHETVIEAIKSWRFKPFKVNGQPMETYTIYKFSFKIVLSTNRRPYD